MTEETDALFAAFFALEDAREILRQSAPKHKLTEDQKKSLKDSLAKARSSIDRLERKLA
jgi:hypothetical protein